MADSPQLVADPWPAWTEPPAIGEERMLTHRRTTGGREICHGFSPGNAGGPRTWRSLGPRTRVRIVSHTLGSAWYGPGCVVTPVHANHPCAGWQFFVKHEDLIYLKKPSRK
jgi:hypothetical protein